MFAARKTPIQVYSRKAHDVWEIMGNKEEVLRGGP